MKETFRGRNGGVQSVKSPREKPPWHLGFLCKLGALGFEKVRGSVGSKSKQFKGKKSGIEKQIIYLAILPALVRKLADQIHYRNQLKVISMANHT